MGFFAILPIPFDILDAAIAEKLTHFISGFVDFSRAPITPCSTIYQLTQHQLGAVGEFRIRKLIDGQSELYVKDPSKPPKRKQTVASRTTRQNPPLNFSFTETWPHQVNI